MIRNLLVSSAIWLISLSVKASCPTGHFEPTIDFGSYFPGYNGIMAAQLSASPDAEVALVYIEFGTREEGFGSTYLVSLLREGLSGDGVLYLNRLNDGKPVSRHLRMSASEVMDLIQKVAPILLKTHYSPSECAIHYTDGYVVQMAVNQPGRGLIGGEIFAPLADWDAGKAIAIGRMLKRRVLSDGISN